MESDNGQSTARGVHKGKNRKGAEGPMQFEPATFAEYAVKADPSRRLTPYDPADAIFTAARMLCADGAAGGPRGSGRRSSPTTTPAGTSETCSPSPPGPRRRRGISVTPGNTGTGGTTITGGVIGAGVIGAGGPGHADLGPGHADLGAGLTSARG